MVTKLDLGDVVTLKKPHPCGSYQWQVTRLGADIGLVCRKCRRYVMMPRPQLQRRLRSVTPADSWDRAGDTTGS